MVIHGGKKDLLDLRDVISSAKKWLLDSGIQNLDQGSPAYGSFNAWYDEQSKNHSFAFSEIPGYGISALLYLNDLTPDRLLIDRARSAADWLLLTAWDSKYGGFQCRYDRSTDVFNNRVCSFDAGMCLNGLVNLYRKTKEAKYLEGAIQVGNWLVQRMQREDGSFYARILTNSGTLVDDPVKWSSQSGSYHAKISIGLLNLFELTKDPIYKESAIKVCDWSLKLQNSSGRFITNRQSRDTHLHPHCYSAEGLLCAGVLLGNKRYVESARRGLLWIVRHLVPTGGVPRTYRDGHFSRRESVDISSQTMRLWLLLSRIYENIEEDVVVEKMATRLCDFQSYSDDPRSRGGFLYGYTDDDCLVNHVSSWGTMFAVQALIMYLTNSPNAFNPLHLV